MIIHKITLSTEAGGIFFGYFKDPPHKHLIVAEFHRQIEELPDIAAETKYSLKQNVVNAMEDNQTLVATQVRVVEEN